MEMSASLMQRAIELFLCWTFMSPSAVLSQAPGFNGGRLVIQSAPHTGANIFINQKPTSRQTNSAFMVGQGTYWVAVTGGPDRLNCGGNDGKVQITSGSVVTLTCTTSGFTRQ
jgi:hypothetical protein